MSYNNNHIDHSAPHLHSVSTMATIPFKNDNNLPPVPIGRHGYSQKSPSNALPVHHHLQPHRSSQHVPDDNNRYQGKYGPMATTTTYDKKQHQCASCCNLIQEIKDIKSTVWCFFWWHRIFNIWYKYYYTVNATKGNVWFNPISTLRVNKRSQNHHRPDGRNISSEDTIVTEINYLIFMICDHGFFFSIKLTIFSCLILFYI